MSIKSWKIRLKYMLHADTHIMQWICFLIYQNPELSRREILKKLMPELISYGIIGMQ